MDNNLLRFKNDLNLVIFDYETCNLNLCSTTNKPWQLAFIVVQQGKVIKKEDFRLKWEGLEVSKEAARITGFKKTQHDKLAVDPSIPLKKFEEYLYNKDFFIVGHNILGFDVYIHNIHRKLLGLKADYSYIDRTIDTVCLGRAIKKEIPFKNGNFLSWQYKLHSFREKGLRTSLQQCCKDYSIDFDPKLLHDALYDIEKNYEVFKKMIWEVEI
tara:strand:- start:490 stop:1128 length:639 start_codon:yes stop_codon:yes gene_type:complete